MSTANRVSRPRVGFPLGGLPSGEYILFEPQANSSVGNKPDTAGITITSLGRAFGGSVRPVTAAVPCRQQTCDSGTHGGGCSHAAVAVTRAVARTRQLQTRDAAATRRQQPRWQHQSIGNGTRGSRTHEIVAATQRQHTRSGRGHEMAALTCLPGGRQKKVPRRRAGLQEGDTNRASFLAPVGSAHVISWVKWGARGAPPV
nr:hypothetical protein [Kibdelosporangium sp. MJ126-NF4]